MTDEYRWEYIGSAGPSRAAYDRKPYDQCPWCRRYQLTVRREKVYPPRGMVARWFWNGPNEPTVDEEWEHCYNCHYENTDYDGSE